MKKILISLGALFVADVFHAQTTDTENYIQSKTYLEPVATSSSTAKQIEIVQYFDGLGRAKQVVNVKASPKGRDVVTHIEYDEFGRQIFDFLPVPQAGTLNGGIVPLSLANATQPDIYGSEKIFSEKVLEKSPLDRILEQKQVGTAWNNKPVKFEYDAVTVADGVRKFTTVTTWEDGVTKSVLAENWLYTDGQLYKNTTTDEDGNKTIEFKNNKGQLIMVRKEDGSSTYYVYNEYDQLAFVLPPLASMGGDIVANITKHEELCYQYRYDNKNRLAEKKLPGKGWEYLLYDKQDRLVGTQDTKLKEKGQWLYTKYDQFGRVAITGICTGGSRSSEQALVDQQKSNNVGRINTVLFNRQGMDVYYDNPDNSYPKSPTWVSLLSIHYYDTIPAYSFNPSVSTISGEPVLTATPSNGISTKGLHVMSLVKNIEDDNWTKSYTYYDTKARPVGTYSINHLGGYTKVESRLDFTGALQTLVTKHKRLSTDTEKIITETFTYDHQNRMLVHKHQIDSKPEEILAQNTYNELSQLETKKVGGQDPASPIQTVNYQYNIRGWMTKINNPDNLHEDLFAYEMKYNTPSNSAVGKFNGNISETDWKTSVDDILKRYSYQYDHVDRLLKGTYSKPGSTVSENNYYDEELTYDVNGNIKTLKRFSKPSSGTTPIKIDDLIYNYRNNNFSNILDKVTLPPGIVNNPSGYNAAENTIGYDVNGNMTDHKDKGKSEIKYNFLNLPVDVDGEGYDYSRYTYRADGVKVKREERIVMMNAYHKETDYLDGFQYDNAALKFVPTTDGYYDFEKARYVYNYTDHLGNVRLSYTSNSKMGLQVLDQNDYYPFGLKHDRDFFDGTSFKDYLYEYNGKEYQKLTGMYDYGARMYMPDLGRWGVVDPLAEISRRWSPYTYTYNNPIRFIDPDGRSVADWFINLLGQMEFKEEIKSQKDLDDKGIKGKYVGETAKQGNLTYAANGYIYDDSKAGGGKAIANGKVIDVGEVIVTKKPSAGRKTWNFLADNIISKPIEGLQFFGYFFYGLSQVPGEMYDQGRMENIHVKMDMTLWGFKDGSLERTLKYVDGETVMTEQEKFEKIAVPGIEAATALVGMKLNLIKPAAANFGLKVGMKTAVKKSIYSNVKSK